MASLKSIMANFVLKEDIGEIGLFKHGKNINEHLRQVEGKLMENDVVKEEWKKWLLRTITEDIRLELETYCEGLEDCTYDWIKSKLTEIYGKKTSNVNTISGLLMAKQENKTVKEFASLIRVKTMKLFEGDSKEDRENLMVRVFINGLKCRLQAETLKYLRPTTLEEACHLISEFKNNECETDEIRLIKDNPSDIKIYDLILKLMNKIESLEYKVDSLRNKNNNHAFDKRNVKMYNGPARNEKKCWNCFEFGHFQKDCRRPPKCKNCFRSGHISQNCDKIRKRPIRNISDDESITSVKTVDILEEGEPVMKQNLDISVDLEANSESWKTVSHRKSKKNQRDSMTQEITDWVNYIDGKKKYAPTLISNGHSEIAANKPLVNCMIEGKQKKILFDTGAVSNVIDYKYLKKEHPNAKVIRTNSVLKCANDTQIDVIGYTVLQIKVASTVFQSKFKIVDQIFPNVIVGIQTMKREEIAIEPFYDRIKIGTNESVAFVSKTKN